MRVFEKFSLLRRKISPFIAESLLGKVIFPKAKFAKNRDKILAAVRNARLS